MRTDWMCGNYSIAAVKKAPRMLGFANLRDAYRALRCFLFLYTVVPTRAAPLTSRSASQKNI